MGQVGQHCSIKFLVWDPCPFETGVRIWGIAVNDYQIDPVHSD